jgi:hypothetical protein
VNNHPFGVNRNKGERSLRAVRELSIDIVLNYKGLMFRGEPDELFLGGKSHARARWVVIIGNSEECLDGSGGKRVGERPEVYSLTRNVGHGDNPKIERRRRVHK